MKKRVCKILLSVTIILVSLAVLVFLGIHLGFIISSLTGYPQPEYTVESYEELRQKLDAAPEGYVLPARSVVLDEGVSGEFTILLKDRFHDEPSGYAISATNADGDASVACQLLSEYDTAPTYTADETLDGVGLGISEFEGLSIIVFTFRDCHYTVDTDLRERGMEIVRSIIGQVG